jgi:16S rRNA (cytosine967-C5)-methyltransferase
MRHLGMLWDELRLQKELPQVDKWLSDKFKTLKQYGSTDRKLLSDGIFLIFRYGVWILDQYFAPDLEKRVKEPSDIWENLRSFDSAAVFPKLTLRLASTLPENRSLRDELIFEGIHPWYERFLKQRAETSEWDLRAWIQNQNVRPPLWLRVNHLDQKNAILQNLKTDGFQVLDQGSALCISGQKGIYGNLSYQNGLFEVQDYASQGIGEALLAKPGEVIWDACAGGGGKTMQIASALKGKGAVIASDIRIWKLEEVKRRAKKGKFHNVRTMPWDSEKPFDLPREAQSRGGFDRILVDAPCSSSGTWRRNPDTKFRLNSKELKSLTDLQFSILSQASRSLKPSGTLVYGTCSYLMEENETIVERFLEENSNFKICQMSMLGSPKEDSDSMFVAVLVKS